MKFRTSAFPSLASVLPFALAAAPSFAAPAKKASAEAPASEKRIVFSPEASVVKWEGKKVTGKHHGTIALKQGEITLAGSELKAGTFEFDLASIRDEDLTDADSNAKLIKHLKSEDFFDVEKYPVARLVVKSAKSVHGLVGPTYEVVGDLTMKGKTNEVKFPVVVKTAEGKTTATANVTVDRTKWDIKYGSGKFVKGLGDKLIYDEFTIDAALATK